MDDFSRYERMRDSGSSPGQVREAGKADGLDPITLIRLVRKVFGLSLADAKRTSGAGEGFEARPVVRVGGTVQWEVFGDDEDPRLMEATVASIEGGTARLERIRTFRMNDGILEELPLEGPDYGELAVSDLVRSLVERLEEAFREPSKPATVPH